MPHLNFAPLLCVIGVMVFVALRQWFHLLGNATAVVVLLISVPLWACCAYNLSFSIVGFSRLLFTPPNREGGKAAPGVQTFPAPDPQRFSERIAVAIPVYHEDARAVCDRIRVMWDSYRRYGLQDKFDIFVLSDSAEGAIMNQEDEAIGNLASELGLNWPAAWTEKDQSSGSRVFLVRRANRDQYKAGNLKNFLERYGWAYDYMLVLDADSVVLGENLVRMWHRLNEKPNVALVQSTIVPFAAGTLFSMAMQHAITRSFPVYAKGTELLFGQQCVYWGHNALLRVLPFMQECNLPHLPGKPPLGGAVLSHDILEAALLGRAGYAVEWETDATGSYDTMPEDILAYGKRDRRWCQGNFQHFWFIFAQGFRPFHRAVMANGIVSYAAGIMIFLLTLIGFGDTTHAVTGGAAPASSFGLWAVVLTLVALPRSFGIVRLLKIRRTLAPLPGGGRVWRESASLVVEMLFSLLMAPTIFYLHTRSVIELLAGSSVTWTSQKRQAAEALSWREPTTNLWAPTSIGIVWFVVAAALAPQTLFALSLILLAWMFSIPLAVFSSSPRVGLALREWGLFPDAMTQADALQMAPLLPVSIGHRNATDALRWCDVIRTKSEAPAVGEAQNETARRSPA